MDEKPSSINEELLEEIAEMSGKIYDIYYDFLCKYQFDFTLTEKNWIIYRIANDIVKANQEGNVYDQTEGDEL